ncbi:hypothetical protein GOEFS_058_00110 [Gordonia effusa NBRC 100432]|uniref:Monooxygenase n=1 Tax=Gordonia effusa NBRC 100432 TaxID=1077974 RepID=H0R0E9_9ACTN|nr:DUF5990 family protein [Gordonia effusa]GAB18550.1 hypothetical protein GOEFS_058_00110 [Gordonia effusa NBRC 100432]
MQITIIGTDLPGRCCPPGDNFPGYTNIHVGIQRRGRPDELLGIQPADAASSTWTLHCKVTGTDIADLLGPHIQGPPGGRFIYLNWGSLDDDGGFEMFRRAKLMLSDIPPGVFADALRSQHLTATLTLTDAKGQPLCARVKPDKISWAAR